VGVWTRINCRAPGARALTPVPDDGSTGVDDEGAGVPERLGNSKVETTQVKALLDAVDLDNAVVTADAVHAQRETAEYIAGKKAASALSGS
jgi:hypothetical protein